MSAIKIRSVQRSDFDTIARIYADEVLHGLASFETVAPSAEELAERWQKLAGAGYLYLVAIIDNTVSGYAYTSPYRPRAAYKHSIENSVYVDKNKRGLGVGKALLSALIEECERGPWRQMIGVVGNSENKSSIRLHESLGFRLVGTLEAVGHKHGQWVDTVILQRALGDGAKTQPLIL